VLGLIRRPSRPRMRPPVACSKYQSQTSAIAIADWRLLRTIPTGSSPFAARASV
jgi:hypothetical protein